MNKRLIIIGGKEDKKGSKEILRAVAKQAGSGLLAIATLASTEAQSLWEEYERVFHDLGVERLAHLNVERRDAAASARLWRILEDATAVFFTGGDQLKITSKLEGTRLADRIRALYEQGGLIAGTSAGASVMSETMLVSGHGEESHKIGGGLHMAPGLGLAKNMIIDQHFAQRGRIGRLLGAVAQNPRIIGVGIDEDTAVVLEGETRFTVIGSGAVYVLDGRDVTYTNLEEESPESVLSLHDVRLHVLSRGDGFDVLTHRPMGPSG
jgi:cyanophycinase